ncbi:leucyl aminopeptidase [Massilia sp. LjRoot122]|uniref:leucyl aminopeptidase n=1 Tax=Massilia sp. LjRoot122 TaxID=3342257 RepID=UPI003F502957
MNITLKPISQPDGRSELSGTAAGCIAVGIHEGGVLTQEARSLDAEGAITLAVESGDISGKTGSTLMLRQPPGVSAQRVLLVGLGKSGSLGEKAFRSGVRDALHCFSKIGARDAVLALPFEQVEGRDLHWALRHVVQAVHDMDYRPDSLKSEKDARPAGIRDLVLPLTPTDAARQTLAQAEAMAKGSIYARELGDLPPNICTPTYLVGRAQALAQEYGFGLQVLGPKEMAELKMHSFLAVAGGSEEQPALAVLQHRGGETGDAPIVLVGKGLTFDSGGISLKPGASMDEMKYDMCGAAAVLGVFRALGELNLPLNVIGMIAVCENMPSGRAVKPGDIVTSMSGLSIEVLNTDAEGRLVLCDALSYAARFKPRALIDIATLTGACVVALGHHNSGLFTRADAPHEELAADLLQAGRETGDPAWRMPLDDVYAEQLKSNFADLANIGSPGGGAVVAAAFLERFTRGQLWAHLDIAGTAWRTGKDKGATGRPVPMLTHYLCTRAGGQST